MNIIHDIDPNRITPDEFYVVVEISAGSRKKYEIDKKTGFLKLDRILHTSTQYPANYGFIPRTYANDRDPLDALVLCTETLDPMIMVKCRAIGAVRMCDGQYTDDKIIAVPVGDPVWSYYDDISQLPPHMTDEIEHFFQIYKTLENKNGTKADEVVDREGAKELIRQAIYEYEIHFCGRIDD